MGIVNRLLVTHGGSREARFTVLHSGSHSSESSLVRREILARALQSVSLDGAGATPRAFCRIYQRYDSSANVDNAGSALQCVIRNIKDEKSFVGLGHANGVSVREHHENIPPSFSRLRNPPMFSNLMFFGKGGVLQVG